MGETLVLFGEKQAKIEPLNAARIGSGFIVTIEGHKIPIGTFNEAMSAAMVFVLGK